VEMYDSKKEAKIGHARWVKVFSNKKLPDQLTDINECSLEDIANSVGHTTRGVFKRAKK